MSFSDSAPCLLQLPFESTPWLDMMSDVLNVFLAFAIRGYLVLILIGLMIYVTGLSDGLAKSLVIGGVILYFVGPLIFELAAGVIGIPPPNIQQATMTWLDMFGMTDAEIIAFIVAIGDIVLATCVLAGAILYFTPSSKNLASRGQSLMVRGLILAPILLFFHVAPWI
jgi:hypothetical protein